MSVCVRMCVCFSKMRHLFQRPLPSPPSLEERLADHLPEDVLLCVCSLPHREGGVDGTHSEVHQRLTGKE